MCGRAVVEAPNTGDFARWNPWQTCCTHTAMAAAGKQDDDDSDGAIHRMDTLPPPEGEDDAYSAATKVGPMARSMVEAMMAKAQVDENSSLPPPASFTRGVNIPKPARLPTIDAVAEPAAVPTAPSAVSVSSPAPPPRASTLGAEVAVFVGTFLALCLLALLAYLVWLR